MPQFADHIERIVQAMSIKYNNMVYEMKANGIDIIVLSLGEAFFDIPLFHFDDLPYPALYHYSHSRGVQELRKKLAQYYTHQYSVNVNPDEEIIVTAGSKIAIHMAFMAILNPGDEVIIHEPAWVSYPEQVRLCHGIPVLVPYHETIMDLGKYVTSRTKVIVLNNPHNPRGYVAWEAEIEYLHELAKMRDIFLLADEAYSDFLLNPDEFISCGWFDSQKKHTIICNSMSKNYGMSGWRIGYIISNPELIAHILKINQHLITCPSTILEFYLAKHFDDILSITKPQIRDVVEKRSAIASFMDSLEMRYLPGSATFYFFVSIEQSRLRSEEFCTRLLDEYHVSTVPGLGYGESCDRHIRVSVGTESMERTLHGIRMIKELISKTSEDSGAAQ
ncbi:MAG: pyridoxal phosphate-dependent aminotransferase [Candidatus Eremiobacteraeota bacterium]|nr:pyridoxal phosphate-dependent aminotransferase [Candidatus Eremiobacteraeota bacterium]